MPTSADFRSMFLMMTMFQLNRPLLMTESLVAQKAISQPKKYPNSVTEFPCQLTMGIKNYNAQRLCTTSNASNRICNRKRKYISALMRIQTGNS